MSSQFAETILTELHNLELPESLTFAGFEVELQDFTLEQLTVLHQNLTGLKKLVLKEKRKKS